ncbi:uncharacterized protein BP5553_10201 [Venustampulla echinocandica]|uniref:DUF676 domain-containing protein n=1 Tax=Venustampulla echinocandica TaxID=2656787 RepID=A0A370T9K1_9HELO|nr:uncharacterized protein BP5553_10201 [Venustampulla echinocandica]RDL30323.1 hypothetical protein BP5553_10201 [Venustampulla echinocandica]
MSVLVDDSPAFSKSSKDSPSAAEDDASELAPAPPEPRKYDCWVAYPHQNSSNDNNGDKFTVDIVFVHGITGSQTGTWTMKNKEGKEVLWPRELLTASDQIPGSRIIMFGYDADVVNFWAEASQNRLSDHADSLVGTLGVLRRRTKTMNRPILFVVHSMGGLVVEEGLTLSRDSSEPHVENVYKATFGVAFLGTPHRGSGLAFWADIGCKFLSPIKRTNKALLQVLKERSETLDGIQRRFHGMIHKRREPSYCQQQRLPYPIKIHCFVEELALKVVGRVVEPDSARLDGWPSTTIHADHMGITRFPDGGDPQFQKVAGVLWGWVEDLKALLAADKAAAANPHSSLNHQAFSQPQGPVATPNQSSRTLEVSPPESQRVGEPALEDSAPASNQLTTRSAASIAARDTPPGSSQSSVQQTFREQHQVTRSDTEGNQTTPSESSNAAAQSSGGEESKPKSQRRKNKKEKGNKTTGSTFNINQKEGGNWAVAHTLNVKGGASLFGTAPRVAESDDNEKESSEDDN